MSTAAAAALRREEHRGVAEQPQRLPRAHSGWQRGAEDPQATPRRLLPRVFGTRRTVEKALTTVIQEAYVQGISNRSVDDLVKSLGMSGVSKSQVSRRRCELDERVNAFLGRQIEGV